jgi:hypothetical protein
MFRPYKAILKHLLIDWSYRTVSTHKSVYYMLLLHVVVVSDKLDASTFSVVA